MGNRRTLVKWTLAGLLAAHGTALIAANPAPAQRPPANTETRNAGFWTDWRTTTQSAAFQQLEKDTGSSEQTRAAITSASAARVQAIANVAAPDAQMAGKILAAAAKPGTTVETRKALQTIAILRTTPAQRSEAIRQMPVATRAAATVFATNLSSGIVGLPGLYLNPTHDTRGSAPAGYGTVSGGAMGCPVP